ncbi:hypothetical protein LHP98_13355 [Rhodobacter sp. Har01]|uniref:hypothetical protein n=1 Tax=Rhodobacter sp. Har01 TaxID=2883999 RepID=UPI001D06DAAA|nr:hypothetical protein [Rhodobacter sp. Har01]MCB6179106.1 hypothetical protein [Rhodobacter sp. Har01]
MDSKQTTALVAVLVVVAAGIYITKGAKDLGIGWKPTDESGYVRTDGTKPGQPTCVRYDLRDGAWTCTAVGMP